MKWSEFFLKCVPIEYYDNRLKVDVRGGEIEDFLRFFRRGDIFIRPKKLSITEGVINFTKKEKTLTFLYGCQTLELKKTRLRLVETTERLNEIL